VLAASTVDQLVTYTGMKFGEAMELKVAASALPAAPVAPHVSGASAAASVTDAFGLTSIDPPPPTSDRDPYTCFIAAYGTNAAALVPQYPDELLAAVRKTVFSFCHKFSVSEAEAVRFFKGIQAEALDHKEELKENISESAVLIWTSSQRLALAPGKNMEFCSLLNRILREHPDLLPSACVVVRGINLLCVTRRDETTLRYPPGGQSHRGGGLPLEHAPFFVAGKKFRVPMFLATSFDEDVAYKCTRARASIRVSDVTVVCPGSG
jgi:hypothetical protein